jgi:hypothetical protein
MSGEVLVGLGTLLTAMVGFVSATVAWRHQWRKAAVPVDVTAVLTRMDSHKVEMISHVTESRIQSERHTHMVAKDMLERMDEGHSTILDMLVELETRVSRPRSRKQTVVEEARV